jgi:hypothetical protein
MIPCKAPEKGHAGASNMRTRRLLWTLVLGIATQAGMAQEYSRQELQQQFVANLRHLCEWAKTNAPEGNPVVVNACVPDGVATFQQAMRDESAWWQHWYDKDDVLYYKLKAAWDEELNKRNAQRAAERKAAARQQANTDRERLIASLPKLSVPDLCKVVRRGKTPEALEELVNRKVYAASETALIAASAVNLGMSEGAMQCSLGAPLRANRSVGSWGTHIQYVYNGITVYVENGKVTSWQD